MVQHSALSRLRRLARSLAPCLEISLFGLPEASALPVFETVHAFELCPKTPEAKLVLGNDGNFYGTTSNGGSHDQGTVFRMTPDGSVSTLVNFAGVNGSKPMAGLIVANDGNFYGTTSAGSLGHGTVFRMTHAGVLTTVASFAVPGGSAPQGVLLQGGDGNFYGTTTNGGTVSKGTVFRMMPGGALTTLVEFTGANGSHPKGGLIEDTNGDLYGMTQRGGTGEGPNPQGQGTVFRLTRQGTLTTLVNFSTYETGGTPVGELVRGNDGKFYGVTSVGGAATNGRSGTIFKTSPDGTLATLVNFNQQIMGGSPTGLTLGNDGNFYGTTQSGRAQGPYGSVFKVTPEGVLTTITDFNRLNGSVPLAGLVQGPGDVFYGSTSKGRSTMDNLGSEEYGTLFKVTQEGALDTLALFTDMNGKAPVGNLIQGSDGYLYGTTTRGGTYNLGTAFRMTHGGTLTTLANFDKANGSVPYGELVQGNSGLFYGTTSGGGDSDRGTVFSMTPDGTVTTLASFPSSGGSPENGVILGVDGNLYGTTYNGGAHGHGTIFRVTPQGSLTTLVNFNSINGSSPRGRLLLADDGNFYGTTVSGGSADLGTVFRMTPSGVLTTLLEFTGTNGRAPYSGLIQASDGKLHGSTSSGGSSGGGTFFRMTLAGDLLSQVNLTSGLLKAPYTGLIEATDGNFYGLLTGNNPSQGVFGEVCQITAQGVVSTVKTFFGPAGANTGFGSLIQGNDGNLYGTTVSGGGTVNGKPDGGGLIFRLRMDLVAASEIAVESPDHNPLVSGENSVSFGSVPFDLSDSVTFKVSSVGTADLKNIIVSIDGADSDDFSIEAPPASLLAASTGTTNFTVRFSPKATGTRAASLQIHSNDSDEAPFKVIITGTGIPGAPEIAVRTADGTHLTSGSAPVPFGPINLGLSHSVTFKIGNIGTAALKEITASIETGHTTDFSIQTSPASQVAVSTATTDFTVRFTPQATGVRTAVLRIGSNDSGRNPFDLVITGTGVQFAPEISVSQPVGSNLTDGSAKKSLGTVKVGKKGAFKVFTIKNAGTAPLTGLVISLKGQKSSFILVPPAKTTLAPGASTSFKVAFNPKQKGNLQASLQIKSNDKDENPFDIKLSGFGAKP